MLSFFIFDWVFVLYALMFIGITLCVEIFAVGAAIILTLALPVIIYFANPGILTFIKTNPGTSLGYIAIYLLLGIGWSMLKWISFVRKALFEYYRIKANYSLNSTNELKNFLGKATKYQASGDDILDDPKLVVPQADKHKAEIIFWMAYWVPSLIGTIVHDWIYDLFESLFNLLKGTYQAVANYAYSKVIKEIQGMINDHATRP